MSPAQLIRSSSLAQTVPYAYAATTEAASRPVYFAGACPLDEQGATVAVGDVAGQTRQCVANLRTAMQDAGVALTDIIYTRVLVATTSRQDLVSAWDVVAETFGDHDVPSTLSGVTVLGYPNQLVELEAVAALSV